ncbi:phosphate ABC transporter permease PstA [Actinomadura nitritigenes]|uniref:phosphate ABC transporter permease PstA n=1 Tax=Actinomadura TaxID=1988 RepID=UPI0016896E74|nr:Phosphate transport system permease protein PstA 1 [Actinomadura sp. RB99]
MTSLSGTKPTSTLASVSAGRKAKDRAARVFVYAAFLLAVIPLVSVLWTVISNGAKRFDGVFLTHSMNGLASKDAGGGAYHAIIGTLEQVGLTALISVPLGVLTAIYLVEYARNGRLGRTISFFVDVMTGIPSIVSGLFVLAFWLLALGMDFSGFAGALSLTILMLPTVVRATEEMLKLVPGDLKEAAYALGVPRWRTIMFVVLPTALPGIVSGVMLAVARVMGETAPLLLTIFITKAINTDPFSGAQGSLPTFIWDQSTDPNTNAVDRAWAGALVLILLIMLLNLAARLVAWLRKPSSR